MENAFSRLLKVLTLERKQGYRNKAVIGGLDKFASRWEVDARAAHGNQAVIGEIVALLIGYPSVEDPSARERILDLVVRRIHETEGAGPARPTAPRPAPTPDAPPAKVPPAAPEPASREAGPAPAKPFMPRPERPGSQEKTGRQGGEEANAPGQPMPERRNLPPATRPVPRRNAEAMASNAPDAWGAAGPLSEPQAPAPETLAGASAAGEPPAGAAPVLPPDEWAAKAAENGQAPAAVPEDAGVLQAPPADDLAAEWPSAGWQPETDVEDAGTEYQQPIVPPTPDLHRKHGAERSETAPGHGLDAPVTRLPSIGPSLAAKLAKLGAETVRDLLYFLPRRYDDYSAMRTIDTLHYGEEVTIIGTVWQLQSRPLSQNRTMTTAVVGDGTGEIQMTWFVPFIERQIHTGRPYLFSGKIDSFRGQLQMRSPEFEPLESLQIHTGRLVPIYPLTAGLSERWLRRLMKSTVDAWAGSMPDFLPARIREEAGLLTLPAAIAQVHFPENNNLLAGARRRLAFDEFFVLQLGVLGARRRFRCQPARALAAGVEVLTPFVNNLPFRMTGAQDRVLEEIAGDLAQTQPMSRLLQGDVGSGKTAVAAAALWVAVANGTQGAILAPTEILAEQHSRAFEKLFAGLGRPGTGEPIRIGLLTGRQRKAERDELLAALAAGEIDIAVGTHALIQDDVAFKELTVAVVDEQHRFGVEQRAALRQKGDQPHMLVMSATPIPRSLALTIYGDLDVSVIDEMPAGRTPIKTKWLTSGQRERAYIFIRRQVEAGHQAFIIYPLVEESETSEAKAAVEEHDHLQREVFPNLRLGLLHGRMKGEEKDAVMRAFAAGELQVLVATSVVEVGIDVPNATVIMIEGAERFGLAQLHQFRGRVGRGEYASYCILVSDAPEGGGSQRLLALETTTDGFVLAQTDMEMRGPGDFLGTRQSGLPPLQLAQLSDLRTLEEARAAAQKLFAEDPELTQPEHRAVAERVAEFWHGAGDVS